MLITAADAPLARQIAETLSPAGGANMWISGLSSDGTPPATHYVSTGLISPEFAALMPSQEWEQLEDGTWNLVSSSPGNPSVLHAMCVNSGLSVSLQEIESIFSTSDVTEQEPSQAFYRLGLTLVSSGEV